MDDNSENVTPTRKKLFGGLDEISRAVLWSSALTAFFTAVALIAVMYFFGLLSFSDAIRFRGGGHSVASVQKLQQVWDSLSGDFYEPVDEDKMIEYAAAAMANSVGDVYTAYYTKDEMRRFTAHSAGVFYGVGVYVAPGDNGRLRVTSVFEGSPALEAGVRADDEIVSVNGVPVEEIADNDAVVSMIKGEAGTSVAIGFYRPSEDRVLELVIERREIKADNIFSRVIDAGGEGGFPIGYIYIAMFDGSAFEFFTRHLDKLLESGVSALIIDLRGNVGGDFEQTVKIAGRMIGSGMIVYTEDRNGKREYREANDTAPGLPLRVLINGNSASASEILAGAIKDNGAGALVGVRTFGKGLVQAVLTLKDGAGLKYTRSRYFTPSGVCIQGSGIEPDIRVELPDRYKSASVAEIPPYDDAQLAAAIEDIEKTVNND